MKEEIKSELNSKFEELLEKTDENSVLTISSEIINIVSNNVNQHKQAAINIIEEWKQKLNVYIANLQLNNVTPAVITSMRRDFYALQASMDMFPLNE